MKSILCPELFEGAVAVEKGDGWLKPWRLPHTQRHLFPSPDEGLLARAEMPSAVRLRFQTDARRIRLRFLPLGVHVADGGKPVTSRFDVVIDNEIVATVEAAPGSEQVAFDGLPEGSKVVEWWLPPGVVVAVTACEIEDGASGEPSPDTRPRWVTYGSSLTHCVRATSPARVWPGIVARQCNLHVTSLGFGGQCHMDPMVGIVIRDLPADYISLKCGINIRGKGSLNLRTFAPNMIGLIQIIREKHPHTPLALVTSFCAPQSEATPNAVGMTLEIMREQTVEVYQRLRGAGDEQLFLCDGLKIVDAPSIAKYSHDNVHHNGAGIEEIGERWLPEVMSKLGLWSPSA